MRAIVDGAYIFANEILAAWIAARAGSRVQSGCTSAHGGGMDVDVAAGVLTHLGALTTFAGDSATLDAEAVLTLRFDTLSITDAGALIVTKGVAEAVAPAVPAGNVLVSIVGVDNGAVAIDPGLILDCRIVDTWPEVIQEGTVNLGMGASTTINCTSSGPITVAITVTSNAGQCYHRLEAAAGQQRIYFENLAPGDGLDLDYRVLRWGP